MWKVNKIENIMNVLIYQTTVRVRGEFMKLRFAKLEGILFRLLILIGLVFTSLDSCPVEGIRTG